MAVLSLTNLSKKFSNGTSFALRNVSLEIQKGELLSLVGESGSGKTTLLRLIAGFETPTAGDVMIDAKAMVDDRTYIPPEQRGVGMVFQGCALFPHLSVADNIGFGLNGRGRARRHNRIHELLVLTGLCGYERRFPHELSGGEQQRVALARALAPKPSLLLLDEPFSNLDESLKARMRMDVQAILQEAGTTAILVTHDTGDALAISKRIAILRNGEIQQVGSPEAIYSKPTNQYVANLFGKTNILDAADLDAEVATPITIVNTNGPHGKHRFLAIRPENFAIVDQCKGSICAEVKEIVFHGRYKSLVLAAQGQAGSKYSFTIYVDPNYKVALKERIHVRPNVEKIHPIQK